MLKFDFDFDGLKSLVPLIFSLLDKEKEKKKEAAALASISAPNLHDMFSGHCRGVALYPVKNGFLVVEARHENQPILGFVEASDAANYVCARATEIQDQMEAERQAEQEFLDKRGMEFGPDGHPDEQAVQSPAEETPEQTSLNT